MAEGTVTPAKAKNQNVELLFQKMGQKLGWFQHKDVDTAIKSLTKSTKKKSTKSRVKHKSGDLDSSNKENKSSQGSSKLHSTSDSQSKSGSVGEKGKVKKPKTKSHKQATDESNSRPRFPNVEEDHPGYPLKPSKASTDLTKDAKTNKISKRLSESPLKETENVGPTNSRLSNEQSDYSDSFPDMPSMLEDIGAPLVESTRIHSRESISFYKLRDSFMSNEGNDSSVGPDQTSFDNLRISSGEDGVRYFQKDKTLIRIRNSLATNELKKKQLDISDKYYSVIGESVIGEEKDEYYSVLEESPLGTDTEKCVKDNQSPKGKEDTQVTNCKTRGKIDQEGQDSNLNLEGDLRTEADVKDLDSKDNTVPVCESVADSAAVVDNGWECTEVPTNRADMNNIRTKYREVAGYKSVVEDDFDSSGSYYEVEDACAQTENIDSSGSDGENEPGSESEREEDVDDLTEAGATVIENKLRVSDLCDRLQGLTHEDEKGSCDRGESPAEETLDDHRHESDEDLLSGKDPSHDGIPGGSPTTDTSDGSFYEVVDQCVQTEAELSQSEDVGNASTSVQVSSTSGTPESFQDIIKPKTLSASTYSTPRLAELQSATYEKLRMSLKKFKNTPTHAGGLMDNVLKKVNLFGPNPSLNKTAKKDDVSGKIVPDKHEKTAAKHPLSLVTSEGVKGDGETIPVSPKQISNRQSPVAVKDKNVKTDKKIMNVKESKLDNLQQGNPDLVESAIQNLCLTDRKGVDDSEEKGKEPRIDQSWSVVEEKKDCQNIVHSEMNRFKEPTPLAETPVKSIPLETPNRRTKLSLKKSIPVKKSSTSSATSVTSEENSDLYKTGFSSPDYSCESPQSRHETKPGKSTDELRADHSSKEKVEPSITIPDSPPHVNVNGRGSQSNEENLFSDEGVAGVPDSASDASCDEFHSVHGPKDNQRDTKVNGQQDSSQGEVISSDSSSDGLDEIIRKKKKMHGEKRSVSSKRNEKMSDGSLSDQDIVPNKDDRYCVTISDTSTWRSSKTVSESSEEEDLEAFFQKMKKPKKTKKLMSSPEASDTDSMKDFIVDDSDVESESEDDLFYLKTHNSEKEPAPRIPKYMTSSDEDSDEESEEETEEESDKEEVFKQKKPLTKPSKKTSGPETPLPKPVPRNYETPKAQIMSASAIPSSVKTSSCVKMYSFLKSLSADLPDHRRHPDASIYVKQFKKYKGELTQRLFKLYNQTVFDHKENAYKSPKEDVYSIDLKPLQLPSSLEISWNNRMLKTAGYCKYMKHHMVKVDLSDKVCDSAERVRDTLIHELCHAASWVLNHKNDGHGPYWKYWTKKANQAHPELAVISRCHSYSIATKYTYQCVGCGYSIGRHSKSLDTDRKVCGKCHGRFEVRLTKDTPKSSSSSTPRTPRTPNKFALFVKEKYGDYKRERKDLKHKDIMQLLSQEFAAKNKLTD